MPLIIKNKNRGLQIAARLVLLIAFFPFALDISFAQIPQVAPPQQHPLTPVNLNPDQHPNTNQQNNSGLNMYEQDRQRQIAKKRQIEDIYKEIDQVEKKQIQYEFPSNAKGTELYKGTFDTIRKMLGSQKPDVKRAIFLVENAYLDNKPKYADFDKSIRNISNVCKSRLRKEDINSDNNLAKIMALYQYFTDTTFVYDPSLKRKVRHLPYYYDFNDYSGKNDYTKLFVLKLLAEGKGQCRSLPLLFLACCQELGAKAYLSFSPSHSFIKYLDDRGRIRNIELTNGHLTTDAYVLGSGYVKGEALKSKIYLDTINDRQVVAQLLSELADGYQQKFGYDKFYLAMIDTSLAYFPNNINAYKGKSNYYTYLFGYVVNQLGKPPLGQLKSNSKAIDIYNKRNEIYDWIDNSGHADMPEDAYKSWLKSLDDEKQKQVERQIKNDIKSNK